MDTREARTLIAQDDKPIKRIGDVPLPTEHDIEVVTKFDPQYMSATLDDLSDEKAAELGRNLYRRALKAKALRGDPTTSAVTMGRI